MSEEWSYMNKTIIKSRKNLEIVLSEILEEMRYMWETVSETVFRRWLHVRVSVSDTVFPAGLLGGLNAYVYGEASPTVLIDPYGLLGDRPDTGNWIADHTFGYIYQLTDGAAVPDWLANGAAGWGDTLSFGITRVIRDAADIGSVDYCSDAYAAGEALGVLQSLAFGGMHLGRHTLANGGKSLFAETRTWKTVSKRWHKRWGG